MVKVSPKLVQKIQAYVDINGDIFNPIIKIIAIIMEGDNRS